MLRISFKLTLALPLLLRLHPTNFMLHNARCLGLRNELVSALNTINFASLSISRCGTLQSLIRPSR